MTPLLIDHKGERHVNTSGVGWKSIIAPVEGFRVPFSNVWKTPLVVASRHAYRRTATRAGRMLTNPKLGLPGMNTSHLKRSFI